MADAHELGGTLIIFSEGTRSQTDKPLSPFANGLNQLAKTRPAVDLMPVRIHKLNRVMPEGEVIPTPFNCTVIFVELLRLTSDESKGAFIVRASSTLPTFKPGNAEGRP